MLNGVLLHKIGVRVAYEREGGAFTSKGERVRGKGRENVCMLKRQVKPPVM